MPDITVAGLSKAFGQGRALNDISFSVRDKEFLTLLGPSGCGKTTLLSCLGGILRPKSGAIKFGGVDVTTLDGRALAKYRRDNVGIVFQAFNLVPSLTALENVIVPLRAAGMSRAASRQRAEELLGRVNLAERMKHRPGDLSGGQQQRVAVARAIALEPPLILADEPTAHLDFIQVEEVLRRDAALRAAAGARDHRRRGDSRCVSYQRPGTDGSRRRDGDEARDGVRGHRA